MLFFTETIAPICDPEVQREEGNDRCVWGSWSGCYVGKKTRYRVMVDDLNNCRCDIEFQTQSCGMFGESQKLGVLSIMPKIPEISVGIQMERSVSVSSDWNIRDHLWRWSTYFGWNIPTEIRRSIFDKPVLCPKLGNSVKEFKMTRAISIGWPGFIRKCRSIFLEYSH